MIRSPPLIVTATTVGRVRSATRRCRSHDQCPRARPARRPSAEPRRSSRYRSQDAAYLRILLPAQGYRARQAYGVPSGVNTVLSASGQRTSCQLGESPGSGDDPHPPGLHAAWVSERCAGRAVAGSHAAPAGRPDASRCGRHTSRPASRGCRDAEPRHAPAVHRQHAVVDGIVTGSGLFHRSSRERDGVTAGRRGTFCRADADSFALRTIRSISRASFRSLAASLGPGRVSRRPLVCVQDWLTGFWNRAGCRPGDVRRPMAG